MKITFPVALFLIFLVLKLTSLIGWSWWWVTSPLWIGFPVTFIALFLIMCAGALLARK